MNFLLSGQLIPVQRIYGSLSNFGEELGAAVFGDVVSDLEESVSAGTFGVNDSLWDSFASEMSDLINEVDVLQKHRSPRTNRQWCVNSHWRTRRGGGSDSRLIER